MPNNKIKTIIVDDEPDAIDLLKNLLKAFPEIDIVTTANNAFSAYKAILEHNPDLLFLDIQMPMESGIELAEKLSNLSVHPAIIFVTAYDKYAVRAFDFSALHYLLKPVSPVDLQNAVNRFVNENEQVDLDKKLKVLNENLNGKSKKLILPTKDGLSIIDLDELIRCEASRNYTTCYLTNEREQIVSKPIGIFEEILSDYHFVRAHNTHLINLKYVSKYIKGKGGVIIMKDNTEISVSKTRKIDFLEKLKSHAKYL